MTRLPNIGPQPSQLPIGQSFAPDPITEKLLVPPQYKPHRANPFLGRGKLIQFNYLYFIHDPQPLIIVTDVFAHDKIRGVNIHYLTFNSIKKLLQQGCGNTGFSYKMFMAEQYVKNAFRSYRWNGIRQIKELDCNFILRIMAMVRSFDPAEVEILRKHVLEQLSRQVNTTAEEIGTEPLAPQGQAVPPQTPVAPIPAVAPTTTPEAGQ